MIIRTYTKNDDYMPNAKILFPTSGYAKEQGWVSISFYTRDKIYNYDCESLEEAVERIKKKGFDVDKYEEINYDSE